MLKYNYVEDYYYGVYHEDSYGPSIEPLIIEDKAHVGEHCYASSGRSALIIPEGEQMVKSDYFAGSSSFGLTELEVYSVE